MGTDKVMNSHYITLLSESSNNKFSERIVDLPSIESKENYVLPGNTIVVPNKYLDDAAVTIRKSDILRIQKACGEAKGKRAIYPDLYLGISTTLIGAVIGAIIAKFPFTLSFDSVFVYVIIPIIGFVLLTAYCFTKKEQSTSIVSLACKIEECLFDPEDVTSYERGKK